MCFRYYSCSISEGKSFGSPYIITHEIGHSLGKVYFSLYFGTRQKYLLAFIFHVVIDPGMEHDGYGQSSKCDKEKYIMSPTTGPGKIFWSECSSENLISFIKYGVSDLRGRKTVIKPICLNEMTNSEKSVDTVKGTLPGQTYDALKQCTMGLGANFKPYYDKKREPFNVSG